jgi:hypothetical protein
MSIKHTNRLRDREARNSWIRKMVVWVEVDGKWVEKPMPTQMKGAYAGFLEQKHKYENPNAKYRGKSPGLRKPQTTEDIYEREYAKEIIQGIIHD